MAIEFHEQPIIRPAQSSGPERVTPQQILKRLHDLLQKTLESEITHRLKGKKRIFVIGPPGSGKSTVIEGLIELLNSCGVKAEVSEFDVIRRTFLDQLVSLGREVHTLSDLTPEEVARFEVTLVKACLLSNEAQFSGEEYVKIVEMPGIGKGVERGQFALRAFGIRASQCPQPKKSELKGAEHLAEDYQGDTLIIHIIADEEVYALAREIRRVIAYCQNDADVKEKLLSLGIDFGPSTSDDCFRRHLLSRFQRMATAEQIDSIFQEFQELVEESYAHMVQHSGEDKTRLLQSHLHVPPELLTQGDADRIRITRSYLFAYYELFRKYRFTSSQAMIVAINPFAQGGIDYSQLPEPSPVCR